jgi:hypothetical protein
MQTKLDHVCALWRPKRPSSSAASCSITCVIFSFGNKPAVVKAICNHLIAGSSRLSAETASSSCSTSSPIQITSACQSSHVSALPPLARS